MHKVIKKYVMVPAAAAIFSVAGLSAFADTTVMVGGEAMYPTKDIVDNAVNSADHTTLVAAVKAAGLVETLKGPGPFTVFAPTDAAFAKLPAGSVEALLADKDKLTQILTYHVVAGKVMSNQVKTGAVKTVQGQTLNVRAEDGMVTVNDAQVTAADIVASNGVIHVIDTVVLPN